jgi:hypothetical protein
LSEDRHFDMAITAANVTLSREVFIILAQDFCTF